MSLQTCITEAKDWAKENSELKLRPSEIEDLGRLLEAAHDAGATPAERMKLMQDAVEKRIQLTQQANQGEKYLNAIKHTQNYSNVTKNIESWGSKPESAPDALEALITGKSSRPGFGVNNDPLAGSRANMARYMNFLENAFSKSESKIFKALKPGDELTKNIMQELDALRQKTQLGTSGSDIALSMAKKLREAQDAVFKEAQAVNPYLRENALYLFSRSHNRELVARVSQEQWVADAKEAFGKNIIGSPEQIDKMLGDTYKAIKSGLPPEATDMSPRFWEPQGTGGSQAIKNAGQRIFVANDIQSEFNYNSKYGDSLYNAFVKQAQRQADYVSSVNKWGTRASDNFGKLFNSIYKSLENPEQKEMLLNRKADLQEKFEATQASRSNDIWSIQGRLAQGLTAMENISMLGNHMPRTLSSGPAMMSQVRDGFGLNFFERATYLAKGLGARLSEFGEEGSKAMDMVGIHKTSVQRDMFNQLAAGNGQEIGKVAKLSRLMGKLSLADYTTNSWKNIQGAMDAHILGDQASKSFENLSPQTQETLRRYDLGDQRWEAMRLALDKDGRMVPDAVKNIPDEALKPLLGDKVTPTEANRMRGELAQNIGTLLNERASMTVAESNSGSRAQAYGLADPNTAVGIARQFFFQFKQASIVRQQLLARTFRSGGGNTSNISGTIQYMLGAAFAGAVGQQLIELGAGRAPLDMQDPKIVGHMIRSTGIAGFYGDILADYLTSPEPDKMKRLTQGDFLGPSFGTIAKAGDATFRTGHGIVQYAEGKDRQNQYGGKQWAQLIHSLTPGQNIFYAKGGIDYTLLNELHEFMGDRGYVGALRQQMNQSKDLFGDRQQFTFGGKNAWE